MDTIVENRHDLGPALQWKCSGKCFSVRQGRDGGVPAEVLLNAPHLDQIPPAPDQIRGKIGQLLLQPG